MFYKMIFLLVLAIMVTMFAVQNQSLVEVNLIVWKLQNFQLSLVILFSALAGALMVGLFSVVEQIKNLMDLNRLKNQLRVKEERLAHLEESLKKQKNFNTEEFLKDTYNY